MEAKYTSLGVPSRRAAGMAVSNANFRTSQFTAKGVSYSFTTYWSEST